MVFVALNIYFIDGKVGRGISYCLVQSGVPKSQIVVVEIAQAGLAEATRVRL